jgi:hypothetical protein
LGWFDPVPPYRHAYTTKNTQTIAIVLYLPSMMRSKGRRLRFQALQNMCRPPRTDRAPAIRWIMLSAIWCGRYSSCASSSRPVAVAVAVAVSPSPAAPNRCRAFSKVISEITAVSRTIERRPVMAIVVLCCVVLSLLSCVELSCVVLCCLVLCDRVGSLVQQQWVILFDVPGRSSCSCSRCDVM